MRPMAPSSTVPTTPARARAGVAGAVVPTPEGCQPAKNCETVEVHDGKGVNWPTAGSWPVRTPREPMTSKSATVSQTARRTLAPTRPLSIGPVAAAPPAGAPASSGHISGSSARSSACAPRKPNWKTRRR